MAELLRVDNLSAGYDEAVVLNGISLTLAEGETLALLGRNGTGKSTLVAYLLQEIIKKHPAVVKAIYKAFVDAKNEYVAKLKAGLRDSAHDKRYGGYLKMMDDPLPMGIKDNLPTINMLIDIATNQGLIPRRMTVDELFIDPDKL